jgi:putative inorganic carbon (HCO3(-)) transporter
LVDWLWVAENGLWVFGLAIMLAALSWAGWQAERSRIALRAVLASSRAGLWVDSGVILIAASLASSARTALERVIWVVFTIVFAVRVSRAAARAPTGMSIVGPPEAAGHHLVAGKVMRPAAAVADALQRLEPALVLVAAPFMLFPGQFTPWLLPLLVLPWLGRGLARSRLTGRSPLDVPVLVLLAMLLVSLLVSTDRQHSLPKFYGVVYGIAVFFAIANHVRRPRHAAMVSLGIAMGGLVVSVVSLAGTSWPGRDGTLLPAALRGLPEAMSRLGGSTVAGFNPNEVAGTMSLFIPFVATLLFLGFSNRTSKDEDHSFAKGSAHAGILQCLLAFTLLLMLANLVLAGSRSALLGVAAALPVLAVLSRRRLWLTVSISLLLCALAWRGLGTAQVLEPWLALSGVRNVQARLELWRRAVYMLQDFAFTGVGLNRYSATANALYPLFTIAPEKVVLLTHAHNVFLQVAVDLGLPGLIAYVALLMDSFVAWWTARVHLPGGALQATGVGLLCSLIAYHVYGLADCLALGAKPGLALWAMLGLMASLANLSLESNDVVFRPSGHPAEGSGAGPGET